MIQSVQTKEACQTKYLLITETAISYADGKVVHPLPLHHILQNDLLGLRDPQLACMQKE